MSSFCFCFRCQSKTAVFFFLFWRSLYILQINHFFFCKKKQNAILFPPVLAHQPLLLSCRFEFISNQRATDKRPILITHTFAYLHINDCRLGCFSAADPPPRPTHTHSPKTLLRLGLPTCCNTIRPSLSSRPHTSSFKLTFHYQTTGGKPTNHHVRHLDLFQHSPSCLISVEVGTYT